MCEGTRPLWGDSAPRRCLEEPRVPLPLWSRVKAVACRKPGLRYSCPATRFPPRQFLISVLSAVLPPFSPAVPPAEAAREPLGHSFALYPVVLRKSGTRPKEWMRSPLWSWLGTGWWQPSSGETLSHHRLSQESLLRTVRAFSSSSCRRMSGLTVLIYTTRTRHS